MDKNRFIMRINWICFFLLQKEKHIQKQNRYILSGSDFVLCRFTSSCLLPRGRPTASEMTCHVKEDKATGQYAAVWLPTCAPYTQQKSLNLLTFPSKTSFTSVSPTSLSICPAWWGLVRWWMATACQDWHTLHGFRPQTWSQVLCEFQYNMIYCIMQLLK